MPKINVKWGKEKLEVDVDMKEPPLLLKSQLFALTGVAPDRQKVVVKGRTLGDTDWNGVTLADGAMIMMMGSAAAIPEKPADVNGEHPMDVDTKKPVKLPIGLRNIGNTCYLNSVIQSLKTIPILTDSLALYSPPLDSNGPSTRMTSAIKATVADLNKNTRKEDEPVLPLQLVQSVHTVLPQFATRSPQGGFQQQDANECFTELQRFTLEELKKTNDANLAKVNDYFRGEFAVTLKCLEHEEPIVETTENFWQISCFLSQEVKYIQNGIKEKMTEEIEKMNATLGRNAKYEKKALISRLPAYLSIQMVRFFYKQNAATNAKILKDVKFPLTLDLFDMCSPALKEKMRPVRDAFKEMEDIRIEKQRYAKLNGTEVPEDDEKEALPFSFDGDEGSNNSGYYDLQAVITHKGRSSDSGHYVAWVRLKGDQWAMCDDDEVHSVNSEQILKLSGGGDWHCAYVLVYGPRRLYKLTPPPKEPEPEKVDAKKK